MLNVAISKDPGGPLRKMCSQVTETVATLHEHGICRGGTFLSLHLSEIFTDEILL